MEPGLNEGLTTNAPRVLAAPRRLGGVKARSSSARLARIVGSGALGEILAPFAARVESVVQVEARVLFLHGDELLKRGSMHDGGHSCDVATALSLALASAQSAAIAACAAYRVGRDSSLRIIVRAEAREVPIMAVGTHPRPDVLGLHPSDHIPQGTFSLDGSERGRPLEPRILALADTWSSARSSEDNDALRTSFLDAAMAAWSSLK
jgi:hypothetical protein